MDTVQGQESREPDTIEMPASTVWPMVAALGVTLMGGGLVTHVLVSAVGLLLSLISAIGWWKDVLPQTRVEHVPLPAEVSNRCCRLPPRWGSSSLGRVAIGSGYPWRCSRTRRGSQAVSSGASPCLNVAPTEPWCPVSRIKSGCHGIRRQREPGAAHSYNVAPRQSESTAGGYDASGWQEVAEADAVCRQDSCRSPTRPVATWRAKCGRNTPSGHATSPSQSTRGDILKA